jgi:hypothetical protein
MYSLEVGNSPMAYIHEEEEEEEEKKIINFRRIDTMGRSAQAQPCPTSQKQTLFLQAAQVKF